MKIQEHLDKNNLHHAYLIEGDREEIVGDVLKFIKSLGIDTTNNPDFSHIELDSFKVEDARNLKSYALEKGLSSGKRIFLISANSFLLEAQNTLLKMFEEPIDNTHFFLIVPDIHAFLKTFVSRFYLITSDSRLEQEIKEAEKFIKMPLAKRIDYIKELLADTEEDEEVVVLNSTRSKSIKFLNALESALHEKVFSKSKSTKDTSFFDHIFKVRQFLRMPGSSTKSLMESVALSIPSLN